MKMLSNCWVVAMRQWFQSHARTAIWTRRSRHFLGLIPHFGTLEHVRGRTVVIRDYIPPLNDLGTPENILVCFRGTHRVTVLQVTQIRKFESSQDAQVFLDSLRG